jgi:hypothetical protein
MQSNRPLGAHYPAEKRSFCGQIAFILEIGKKVIPKETTYQNQHASFVFPLFLLPEILEDADYFKLQARNHPSGFL